MVVNEETEGRQPSATLNSGLWFKNVVPKVAEHCWWLRCSKYGRLESAASRSRSNGNKVWFGFASVVSYNAPSFRSVAVQCQVMMAGGNCEIVVHLRTWSGSDFGMYLLLAVACLGGWRGRLMFGLFLNLVTNVVCVETRYFVFKYNNMKSFHSRKVQNHILHSYYRHPSNKIVGGAVHPALLWFQFYKIIVRNEQTKKSLI